MKFKATNNRTVVSVAKRLEDEVAIGDRKFILDNAFRQYWNTVQMAEVIATGHPEIEVGDIVYVHHFVSAPEQKLPVEGNYSYVENSQIFCKMKGDKAISVGMHVLVEPITYGEEGAAESSSGLLLSAKSPNDKLEQIGRVRHLSRFAKDMGLEEGDKVLFGRNCDYEILVDGKVFYNMNLQDVITVLGDEVKIKI